jgi:DNA-binding MarR family transcriptional regulator
VVAHQATLTKLSELCEQMSHQLDVLRGSEGGLEDSEFKTPFRYPSDASEYDAGGRIWRAINPPPPDPRLVRRVIRRRQLRARYFDGDLFSDPAWDILLDLTAARAEHKRVSVTSACIASGVPASTALRWIKHLSDAKLITRTEDDLDRRRSYISLTDEAALLMARYFADMGSEVQTSF